MKRLLVPLLICPFFAAFAGEIREFDLKRVERLGLELDRVSRRPDRGATNDVRKRARQTGIDAVKGRLYKIHYEFVVVDDPGGTGFLIYALPSKAGGIVLSGWERVEDLSRTILPVPKPSKGAEGQNPVFVSMSQIVSNKPLETCVYTSLHDKVMVSVGMVDDGKVWVFIDVKSTS